MVFQTNRDIKSIFYLEPFEGEFSNFTFDYDHNGFIEVDVQYSFSNDNVNWSEWENTTDSILSDGNSIAINTYIRIKIITKKDSFNGFCSFEIEKIEIDGNTVCVDSVEEVQNEKILTNTNTKNLFDPYRKVEPQQRLHEKISKSISDIFSFECVYFKVSSLEESGSVTFKSYRLKNVIDQKPLDVVIKNNNLPGNRYVYSELDIDFQDELELHIIKQNFEEAFGINHEPENNDFLYLPLTERMYEVNTASNGAYFMNKSPFWKTYLTKYENRDSVQKEGDVFDSIPEDIDTLENYKKEERENEENDALKPFDEVNYDISDNYISEDSPDVEGIDFSYYFPKEEGFSKTYNFKDQQNLSICLWIKYVENRIFLIGSDQNNSEVFNLEFFKNEIVLSLGVNSLNLNDILLENGKWIGVLINISKENGFVSISVYDEVGNLISENSNSSIDLNNKFINNLTINSGFKWTNIRIFKYIINKSDSFNELTNSLPNYKGSIHLDNPNPNLK